MARLQTQLLPQNVPRFTDHTAIRCSSGPKTQCLAFPSKRPKLFFSAPPPTPTKRPVGMVQALKNMG